MVRGFSHYWNKKEIRDQLAVVQGRKAPTMILTGGKYLNSFRKIWQEGNIWIHKDRIIYTGVGMPENTDNVTIIDLEGKAVVPGYIEHHAHPFQLYNPLTLAKYAAERGTTTLINDNMPFIFHLTNENAIRLIEDLQASQPATLLWWARYDGQTELINDHNLFLHSNMKAWLDHPYVVQGGELTDWPSVLKGNDQMLHWMLKTKDVKKPIEGHLPGAGEKTLSQMAILGVNGDHESMSGEDILKRLDVGMTASIRHSSIRPDLPKIIRELHDLGLNQYDQLMMNTDGSPPHFLENGMMEYLIELAVAEGVPIIEAINMCTVNVARHFYMEDVIGMIAPGRLANLNILEDTDNPRPVDVMAKGIWVRKNDEPCYPEIEFDWASYGFTPQNIDWELSYKDFHFSMPVGVEMMNEVIMKPYRIGFNLTFEELPEQSDEMFMIFADRHGKWIVSTLIKGFASDIYGMASSFSGTGDIILIGKSKKGLLDAFSEMKQMGGGIVVMDRDGPAARVPLVISGVLSDKTIDGGLMAEEKQLREVLKERGYKFNDPIYSLLFFSSTHLPYVRVTQRGIFDVKKKRVLFPSIMR